MATPSTEWAAFGKAMQGLSTDAAWQKLRGEVMKVFDLQDRSIFVGEEI